MPSEQIPQTHNCDSFSHLRVLLGIVNEFKCHGSHLTKIKHKDNPIIKTNQPQRAGSWAAFYQETMSETTKRNA